MEVSKFENLKLILELKLVLWKNQTITKIVVFASEKLQLKLFLKYFCQKNYN